MSLTDTIVRTTHDHTQGRLTRAVLVDDHRLLAQSLALALGFEGMDCFVPELTDRDALLHAVVAAGPALVLLDLDLGEAIGDGADLVAPFVSAGCRVLVVSGSTDADHVCRAVAAGAAGVIGKNAPFERLLEAALAVARGDEVLESCARMAMLDQARQRRVVREQELAPFERLTSREGQVLRALASGHGVAAIAESWFLSEATVRSQVRAILSKLGVSSQLEAVAAAHRHQWLHPSS